MDKTTYSSLSMAATAVTKTSQNGWKFWKFEDNGKTYFADALRNGGNAETVKRVSKKKDAAPVMTVTRPAEDLPLRNTRSVCADYYVDEKKYARWGHITVFLFAEKTLLKLEFKSGGKFDDPEVLGEFDNWPECRPVIDAAAKKLIKVKAVA